MTFDINKADIVDTSHVDAALASVRLNEENARRRATVLTWSKAILLGGIGVAAIIAAASLFLLHPKVIETTKVVEKPVIIEKPVIVERERGRKLHPVDPPKVAEAPKPPEKAWDGNPLPKAPLPPPAPAPTTETHPWDKLADKKYVGIITDVTNGEVCLDHDTQEHHCIQNVMVNPTTHHAVLEDGHNVQDPNWDLSPMVKWIGYSVYKADNPADPKHLADYWVADKGELIKFESAPKGKADVITLKSDGTSLLLDAGLGGRVFEFILDTGASSMTVTPDIADWLVRDGHAAWGEHETVTYADGKPHDVRSLNVYSVTVGQHTVSNVHVSVTPPGSPMLLGLNVLNAIGRFEVDAPHRTLTFNGAAS